MKKTDTTPLWVFLAFSSIETRKGALMLIWSSVIFSFYCVPWVNYFSEYAWVAKLFLIEDWSWLVMMLPVVVWYWLSMKWIDKNSSWEK
ncbi:MAG: hypothetical protein NTX38_04530 [Methylobacter sp.]|nr:hypothetical protein [Methylobacter sp.]